jgi:putative PIN family toxin of toxin-antitoxin system
MGDTIMRKYQVALDTNVFVAALRSRRGASYKLLAGLDSGKFELNISVPLILEYEDVAKRQMGQIALDVEDIDAILDYICKVANWRKIYFLWRPTLKDQKDDMVLELAVTANCDYIVTYNKADFRGAEQFGIEVLTAKEFLQRIGELP